MSMPPEGGQPQPPQPYPAVDPYAQQPQQAQPQASFDPTGQQQPQQAGAEAAYGQPPTGHAYVPAVQQPYPMGNPAAYSGAPIGQVRGTGLCMVLAIVTLGFYSLFWYFKVHDEMKRHSGSGLGGGLALVLAFFVGIVMPFITASEIGDLYKRSGMNPPVSGLTGLWLLLPFAGPFIWFIKTNGAINGYWRSLGAV